MNLEVLLYVFLGGLVPALLWLWFWLREDSAHPEPRGIIVVTFIAGMLSVVMTIMTQSFLCGWMVCQPEPSFNATVLLALVEEIMKYGAAYVIALRSGWFDEPIDAIIFMVTAALGFVAVENFLFMISAFNQQGSILDVIATGNLRFVGASLLHITASATVGICIALSFFGSKMDRRFMTVIGIFIATALHTLFNLSIISNDNSNILWTFLVLWFSVICLLVFFEKIKRLNQINTL